MMKMAEEFDILRRKTKNGSSEILSKILGQTTKKMSEILAVVRKKIFAEGGIGDHRAGRHFCSIRHCV